LSTKHLGTITGYDTGIVSGAILLIQPDMDLTTVQTEWIVSGVTMGAAVGGLTAGRLSESIGRKPVIMLAAAIFLVGAFVKALSVGFWTLFLGRLIVGVGIGIC
jgi:MFS family permease